MNKQVNKTMWYKHQPLRQYSKIIRNEKYREALHSEFEYWKTSEFKSNCPYMIHEQYMFRKEICNSLYFILMLCREKEFLNFNTPFCDMYLYWLYAQGCIFHDYVFIFVVRDPLQSSLFSTFLVNTMRTVQDSRVIYHHQTKIRMTSWCSTRLSSRVRGFL